jgi:hypothetical protein
MTCPICGKETTFKWCCDFEGNEWAECSLCGGLTDQGEINAVNHEDEGESRTTRIDISFDSPHPGRPESDWLHDLVSGVFQYAARIEIEALGGNL